MVLGAQPADRGRGVERSSQRTSSHSTPEDDRPSTVPPTLSSAPHMSEGLTSAGSSHTARSLQSCTKFMIIPATHDQFIPSASRKIGEIFKEKFVEEGTQWTKVPKDIKEYYWDEFQKFYQWDSVHAIDVRTTWNNVCQNRYNDKLCKWRYKYKEGGKPLCIPDNVWNKWQEYWRNPEFKLKSQQASKNRKTEKAVEGSGVSKHIGGSKSTIQHSIDMLGRAPIDYEVFKHIHTKKDITFVDKRSSDINAAVEQMVAIASQFSEESGEPDTQLDTNRLYLDDVGVDTKKRRVYGLDSLASLSDSDSLRSSGRSYYGSTFDDTFEQRVQDRVRIEMQIIQQRLDEEQRKRNEELLDLKQKMAEMERYFRMMRDLSSQPSSSGPPYPPTNCEETDKDD